MNASRASLLAGALLVAAVVRPAASDSCRAEDRDAEGKCPRQPPGPKRPVRPPPATGGAPSSPPATGGAPSSPSPRLPPPASATSCPEGMLRVPAGTFQMGSDGNMEAGSPRHAVTLSAYCIDRTEVTVKAYGACVAAGRCAAAATGRDCNGADRPTHPINCVDWHQAVAYCQSRGLRLPTEAEWEYAARGGDGREYPWGNGWEDVEAAVKKPRLNGRGSEDGWATTAPVASFPAGASPFGALDMAGNVSEWTADRFGMYTAAPATNPQGPPAGPSSSVSRMIRGGSWDVGWPAHRAMQRSWGALSLKGASVGLRCAGGG